MKQSIPHICRTLSVWLVCYLASLTLGSGRAAEPLELMAPFNQRMHKEVFEGPKPVLLPGGMKAETVVLRETRWELKNMPQGAELGSRWERDAMKLPEADRLKIMNRTDNHTQMWFVRLADHPEAGAGLKSVLPPNSQGNEYHCEVAFLGKASGCAWFGFMPIYEWILLQRELGFREGDDPLPAAARGLSIEDRGSMTANGAEGILVTAGARSLPWLKPVLAGTNYSRALRVLSLIPNQDATDVLLKYAYANDPEIAARARYYTIIQPRADAEKFYFEWLERDAGRVDVLNLLRACAKVNKPRLAPFLPRVLAAPHSIHELRLAFELSRSLAGKEIPADLLQAEETIKRHGYKSGPNFNQQKVDEAVAGLVGADDVDSAACIGLSLALATTKGDWRAANEAGCVILQSLPNQRGRQMAKTLDAACDDLNVKERLKKVVGN